MTADKNIQNQETTRAARQHAFNTGLFLSRADMAVLIFASLMINLFALAVPLVTLQVYDRILAFNSESTLAVLCAGVFVIVLLDMGMRLCRSGVIGWASARFEFKAYTQALKHMLSANLQGLRSFSQGEQLHKLGAIAKLKSFYSGQSLINLIDVPFILIFLGFIAYLAGWLVLVPLVLLAVFSVYAISLGHSMKQALSLRDGDDDARITFISDILEKVHTVKMLGLEAATNRTHEALQGRNIEDSYRLNAKNAQSTNAAALFTQVMMVSMISIGAVMVLQGQITMGVLIACVLLSGRIMQPLQRALAFWVSFQEYRLSREKIDALFALPMREMIADEELKKPKGKIDITGLCFGYREDVQLFDKVSLKLTPGKVISINGPTGDGKSTFLKLVAGLYAPQAGSIKIDGMEVCTLPKDKLPEYIGYLSSEADIFQGSIMDNLTSFRSELEEQALEIAKYLGIHNVVSKLSRGYQTQLFDGPADPVTPGMKQRITIARVLVNRPRVLLFNFADKALDKDGYNHLFRLLGQLKGQATMVLVSNDHNILHLADEDYIFENGKLVAYQDSRYSKESNLVQPLKELRT